MKGKGGKTKMRCWYCDRNLMNEAPDLGRGWFKCKGCGATWVKPLKLGPPCVTIESGGSDGKLKYKPSPLFRKRRAKK